MFELNDRLIRDKELDGFTEIPVKPSPGVKQLKPNSDEAGWQADELEEFVPSMLQGQCHYFSVILHGIMMSFLIYIILLIRCRSDSCSKLPILFLVFGIFKLLFIYYAKQHTIIQVHTIQ